MLNQVCRRHDRASNSQLDDGDTEKKAVKHSAFVVPAPAFTVLLAAPAWAAPQESPAAAAVPTPASKPAAPRIPNYVLGPDDVII